MSSTKSDVLLGLIKEVVKNEVKQQLKEELFKLAKSGAITINKQNKPTTPTLKEAVQMDDPFERANAALIKSRSSNLTVKPSTNTSRPPIDPAPQKQKVFTNNPLLNEVLNATKPFTAAERSEGGGMATRSVLDMIPQPEQSEEAGWETLSFSTQGMPTQQIPMASDDPAIDAVTKALTRDYSQLVKRF